jgi:serine/threonine protein phosphatase PrpC
MLLEEKIIEALDQAVRANDRRLSDSGNCLKPCEDCVICDPVHGTFIVLDGITRVHKEYSAAPGKSAACDVNEIFVGAVMRYIADNHRELDAEKLLRGAVKSGNDRIREFRSQKSLNTWGFYPGTLGIIALIRGARLHYICAGDCVGMILRGNTKICFGEQLSLAALEIKKISKKDRYDIYCNHPENKLSYTIFNGDECVPDSCEYANIDLQQGDIVVLASDGIKNYLKYEFVDVIKTTSADRLIDLSMEYDAVPFGTYSDDKSLLKFIYNG